MSIWSSIFSSFHSTSSFGIGGKQKGVGPGCPRARITRREICRKGFGLPPPRFAGLPGSPDHGGPRFRNELLALYRSGAQMTIKLKFPTAH